MRIRTRNIFFKLNKDESWNYNTVERSIEKREERAKDWYGGMAHNEKLKEGGYKDGRKGVNQRSKQWIKKVDSEGSQEG